MTDQPAASTSGGAGVRPAGKRPRIVAIIAAFNEADVIESVITHLAAEGISVYFIDDGSTDGTRDIAERLIGRGVIGVEEMPANDDEPRRLFDWQRILSRKAALAGEIDADWFIHHDADEFRESPWPHLTLSAAIEQVDRLGYNAIDFWCLDFWPTHDVDARGRDVRDVFTHFEPCAAYNQTQIKCWKKGPAIDLVSSGGHEAQFDGRHVFPIRFLLRHYPIRGQEHGARKVFQERANRFRPGERARGWHVQYDTFQPGASFLRDPATLTPYDAEAVRLSLMLHHRGVEELERSTREADGQWPEADVLRRELAAAQDSLQQVREEVSRTRSDLEQARSTIDQQSSDLARAGAELERLAREYQAACRSIEERDRRLRALYQSLAWRATWPARAAYDAGRKGWSVISRGRNEQPAQAPDGDATASGATRSAPQEKRWHWSPADTPWFDQPNCEELLERRRHAEGLGDDDVALLRRWLTDGYVVIGDGVGAAAIDAMEADLDALWGTGEPIAGLELLDVRLAPDGPPTNISHADLVRLDSAARKAAWAHSNWRIHGFHRSSLACAAIFNDQRLARIASLILGVRAAPAYCINFTRGSEQHLHQDTAVFHVVPPNYLVGAWIASEDISPESGPLIVYPGSHRSPMYDGFDNYPQTNLRTAADMSGYTAFVEGLAARFERKEFLARKGDVLFWHGMLIHGGSPVVDRRRTRRSYVCHYIPPGMDAAAGVQGPFNW